MRDVARAMSWMDRMERKFGGLAFPGLLKYYIFLNALVYGLQFIRPGLGTRMVFDVQKIMAGEVWRVLTFLLAPAGVGGVSPISILFLACAIGVASMISDALESMWGVFRTSVFCYVTIAGLIAANLILPGVMRWSGLLFYEAVFFAFATLFPRVEFRIMFVLPVQVRFLAILGVVPLLLSSLADWRIGVYVVLANLGYLVFAGLPALRGLRREVQSVKRRASFRAAARGSGGAAFHTCEVCGRNDVEDPELEFRVGQDGREYCLEHLPEDGS